MSRTILSLDAAAQRAWNAAIAEFKADHPGDAALPLVRDIAERAYCSAAEIVSDKRHDPRYERTMFLTAGLVIREAVVGWHRAGTRRAQG